MIILVYKANNGLGIHRVDKLHFVYLLDDFSSRCEAHGQLATSNSYGTVMLQNYIHATFCIINLLEKILLFRIILPIFPPSSHSQVMFLSCRPFVVNATISTGLLGVANVLKTKGLQERNTTVG